MPLFLSTQDPDFMTGFTSLLGMKREEAEDVDQAVATIIADVRCRGDAALIDLTRRFDRFDITLETLVFSSDEIASECAGVLPEDRAALER